MMKIQDLVPIKSVNYLLKLGEDLENIQLLKKTLICPKESQVDQLKKKNLMNLQYHQKLKKLLRTKKKDLKKKEKNNRKKRRKLVKKKRNVSVNLSKRR